MIAATAVALGLGGCSDSGSGSGSDQAAPPAPVTPTAVGDRPVVDVLGEGGGSRRTLALELGETGPDDRALEVTQRLARDGTPVAIPPTSYPFTVSTAAGTDGATEASVTYGEPTVDGEGQRPVDVATVRDALAPIAGTTSTLSLRPDGTVVSVTSGDDAASQVDTQLQLLLPVLPGSEVGVGASWSVTSVVEVDGATVDQVATYTLESLEGSDYVIGLSAERTYRPGPVEDVAVQSGSGTVSARLVGSLDRAVPDQADGSLSTQVSYVVGNTVTQVRTSATLSLTSG